MYRSLLFSSRFFQYIFQFWETHFQRVSMRSPAGVGSCGVGGHFAASLANESAISLFSMIQCDRVHLNCRVSCWPDTVSLITPTVRWWGCLIEDSACMTDIKSVHITRRIVQNSAHCSTDNIEKEDGRMHWRMICELLVTAQHNAADYIWFPLFLFFSEQWGHYFFQSTLILASVRT